VLSFYDKVEQETYDSSTLGDRWRVEYKGSVAYVFFVLKHVPVERSLRIESFDNYPTNNRPWTLIGRNLVQMNIETTMQLGQSSSKYVISYVPDKRGKQEYVTLKNYDIKIP
jgi:hypothetical protein